MTENEFNDWFERAHGFFTSVGNYFSRPGINPEAIKRTWFKILEPYEKRDCVAVIDRMYEGSLEVPRSVSDWPAFIKGQMRGTMERGSKIETPWCRCGDCGNRFRLTKHCPNCKSINKEIEYRCGVCFEQGVVVIWNLEACQKMRRAIELSESFHPKPYQSIGVKCHCKLGQERRWPRGTFSASNMCPTSQDLQAFVENAMGVGAARTAGFDAFNEQDQEELF